MKTPRTYKEKWKAALTERILDLDNQYYKMINTSWNPDLESIIEACVKDINRERAKLRLFRKYISTKEATLFIPRDYPKGIQLSLKLAFPKIYDKLYNNNEKKIRTKKENSDYIN